MRPVHWIDETLLGELREVLQRNVIDADMFARHIGSLLGNCRRAVRLKANTPQRIDDGGRAGNHYDDRWILERPGVPFVRSRSRARA